ncbi:MAG: sulfite exporter TauE/SafE family protein [Dehalococcoidia bacterium]
MESERGDRADCPVEGQGALLQIELLLLVPLGIAVGAFGTIVGAGGGFILVPILLFLFPDETPQQISAISLFVVLTNAMSGSVAYARQGRIDYRSGLGFAIGTLPGAVGGAIAVGFIPRRAFDGIFALVLMGLGTYLLVRRGPTMIQEPVTGRGVVRRTITDGQGNTFVYSFQMWKGVGLSGVVGFFSSLLGIGGGIMHVPIMTSILHFPVHIAVATSQFVLGIMAAQGTAVHFSTGTLGWNEPMAQAALLSAGAIPGAQVGARAARRLRGSVVVRMLAVALVLVGFRLGLKALGA